MDLRIAIEALLAVAGFLSAFWIRSMRDDIKAVRDEIKDAVKTLTNHGERIAVLESRVERIEGAR